jgi:hypothetical protein
MFLNLIKIKIKTKIKISQTMLVRMPAAIAVGILAITGGKGTY